MIINTKVRISYICSLCGNGIKHNTSLFSLADKGEHHIICPSCRGETVMINKTKKHDFLIKGDCCFCGEPHQISLSPESFLRFGALRCPLSGLDILFHGNDEKQVDVALEKLFHKLEQMFSELNENKNAVSTSSDMNEADSIENEMLRIFNILNKEQNISCACGRTDILIGIKDNKIFLKCAHCGKNKKYDISKDNLLRLINTSFVVLSD